MLDARGLNAKQIFEQIAIERKIVQVLQGRNTTTTEQHIIDEQSRTCLVCQCSLLEHALIAGKPR